MKQFYQDAIQSLIKNNFDIEIYRKLAENFGNMHMYQEQVDCLEAILHIKKEPAVCLECANILSRHLNNRNLAHELYNDFLRMVYPNFYKNYVQNLHKMGYYEIFTIKEKPIAFLRMETKLDLFRAISYCINALCKEKKYSDALNFRNYLYDFLNQDNLEKYLETNTFENYKILFNKVKKALSLNLSKVKNHNDINRFAIELDLDNYHAYINILDDLVTYNNYQEAINFYNNEYAKQFKLSNITNIQDICWHINNYYRDHYDFYNAVRLQKLAIELELSL